MRVGFDLRPSIKVNSRRRGVGRFTSELIRHLLEADDQNQYVVYDCAGEGAPDLASQVQRRRIPLIRRPSRANWLLDRWTLPGAIRRDRLDVFHATDQTSIPVGSRTRVWAYIHDLIPFLFWEETRRKIPPDFIWALRISLQRASRSDLIVTVSETSKRDICEHLDVDPSRVAVVYQGCDSLFRPVDPEEGARVVAREYGLSAPFLLYVGGSDFRKNVVTLVEAFSAIRKLGYSGRLVLVGETFGWDIPEVRKIREVTRRCGIEDRVDFLGYVPDRDLAILYGLCDFFIFPSLYEGFGIPILEALQCGAVTIAARAGALPEVAGSAARYFDPQESESLVQAFESLYGDEAARKSLRKAGFERVKRFSWPSAARDLMRYY